jgi:hypothetical protein
MLPAQHRSLPYSSQSVAPQWSLQFLWQQVTKLKCVMPPYIEQFCLAASGEMGSCLVVTDTSVVVAGSCLVVTDLSVVIMGLAVVAEVTVSVETVVTLTLVVVDTETVVSLRVVVVDTETVVSLTDEVVGTDIVVVAAAVVATAVTFPLAGRLQHQHRHGFAAPKNLYSKPSAVPFSQFARPMVPL